MWLWPKRLVISCWRNRSIVSVPARWRGLAWTDRSLFRWMRLEPRLLSTTVDRRRVVLPKRKLDTPSMSDGLWQWVWQNHSVGRAIFLAILMTVLLLGVCALAGGIIFRDEPTAAQFQIDVSTLNTLAQVTGAIFATLLAVVTFSVGLRAQREDDASALLPFVAQRYGMFLIAGAAVAVTAADGIMPVLEPWVSAGSLRFLLVLNIVLVPATLILALWLVCKVIQDAGVSNLENTLPVFRAKMRSIALRDVWQGLLFESYSMTLATEKIEYNGIGWHIPAWSKETREEFSITGRGRITNVDLRALRRLGSAITALGPSASVQITVRPGDLLNEHAQLIVTEKPVPEPGAQEATQDHTIPAVPREGFSPEVRGDITAALRRLFITRRGVG